MSAPATWQCLREGETDGVVLAVDFDGPGRPEATFAALARLLDPAFSVWLTTHDPLPGDAAPGAAGRTARWVAGVRERGSDVRAVLGFCVGGCYALQVAHALGDATGTPPALLFDPEPPSPAGLREEFDRALGRLATLLSPAELSSLRRAADEASRSGDGPIALGARLSEAFRTALVPAMTGIGVERRLADEAADRFAAMMSYLAEGVYTDETGWQDATVFSSSPPNPWSGRGGTRVEFPVDHNGLLADRAVAARVDALLAGRS